MKAEELLKIIPLKMPYSSDCVTFLENSDSLHSEGSANNLRNFLIENKIRHNVVGYLEELTPKHLVEVVKKGLNCVLAFETTGLSNRFHEVKDIIIKLSNEGYKFTLIECVIDRATIGKIPQEANDSLELYSLDCYNEDMEDWELIKREK